jgi:hypothetical protein
MALPIVSNIRTLYGALFLSVFGEA